MATLAGCFGWVMLTAQLALTPDPENYAVCPGLVTTYRVSNWSDACYDVPKVINGTVTVPFNATNGTISISWLDNGSKGKIEISKKANAPANCTQPARTWDVPILTLVGTAPTIAGSTSVSVGTTPSLNYTAALNYPYAGKLDFPKPLPVGAFSWTVPSGWVLTSFPPTAPTVTLAADLSSGGTITAFGINTGCPGASTSAVRSLAVSRFMPAPCPAEPEIPYELCGQPTINCLTATLPSDFVQPPGGVTYAWTFPPGWTPIGLTNRRQICLQTNGQNGGTATVRAFAYGFSSTACSLSIPLEAGNPETRAVGPEVICQEEIYNLNIPLPPGSSATWSVSAAGSIPVTPTSGAGATAKLTANAGLGTGQTIDLNFTITGCGDVNTVPPLRIFVGPPNIYNMKVDGYPYPSAGITLCPGWHILSASVIGDADNCLNWSVVQGPALTNPNCSGATIYINPDAPQTSIIKVSASNKCADDAAAFFYLIPVAKNCDEEYVLKISPNPAHGQAVVQAFNRTQAATGSSPVTMNSLQIYDFSGAPLLLLDIENTEHTLDLSGWAPGFYQAQATINGVIIHAPFYVERE